MFQMIPHYRMHVTFKDYDRVVHLSGTEEDLAAVTRVLLRSASGILVSVAIQPSQQQLVEEPVAKRNPFTAR